MGQTVEGGGRSVSAPSCMQACLVRMQSYESDSRREGRKRVYTALVFVDSVCVLLFSLFFLNMLLATSDKL